MILFFDTETTGLFNNKLPITDSSQPDLMQIAMILCSPEGVEEAIFSSLVSIYYPEEKVHPKATEAHGISVEKCKNLGIDMDIVSTVFLDMLELADTIVGHNIDFDVNIVRRAVYVAGHTTVSPFISKKVLCTMKAATDLCKLPGRFGNNYKWPTLMEAHTYLFQEGFEGAHDALADVRACKKIYFELKKRGKI